MCVRTVPQCAQYEGRATGQVSVVQTAFLCLAGKCLLLPLPGQCQAGFLPQLSTKPHSSPYSKVLAPPFIYAAWLAFVWLLLYLLSLTVPFVLAFSWRWLENKAWSPLPLSPWCRGFPIPLYCLLLLLGSLCELCSWCLPRGGCISESLLGLVPANFNSLCSVRWGRGSCFRHG